MRTHIEGMRSWLNIGGGAVLLIVGLVLCVLPGPGIPLIVAGFALWAREFEWAAKLKKKIWVRARWLRTAFFAWRARRRTQARGRDVRGVAGQGATSNS